MWTDSGASSSRGAPVQSHVGVTAPGHGIPIGKRKQQQHGAPVSKQGGVAERWLHAMQVAGLGGSCLGRSSHGSDAEGDKEPCSRASFADFLGVPDDPQAVTNMVLAHAAQFTYAVGSEMTHVVLPFINMTAANGSLQTYGLYRSLNGIAQTAGGLAFGRFADVCGVKASMLTAHAATLVYYGIVGSASSQQVLFLSLVPAAAMHGFQATQMAAASFAPVEKRAQAFGHVSFVYGTGFIVGTALVAFLGKLAAPGTVVLMAAGMEALVIGALAWKMHDASADDASLSREVADGAPSDPFLSHITELLNTPGVQTVLLSKLSLCAASGIMLGMAPQFALDPFGLNSVQVGLLMGYVGVSQLAAQACTGWFQGKVGQLEAVQLGYLSPSALAAALSGGAVVVSFMALSAPKLVAMVAATGAFPLAHVSSFIFWLGPMAAAQQLAQVALTVELTARAPKRDMGFVLGVDMSMFSLSSIVTPLVAVELARTYGFYTIPVAGAALALASSAGCLIVAATPQSADRSLLDEELVERVEPEVESW